MGKLSPVDDEPSPLSAVSEADGAPLFDPSRPLAELSLLRPAVSESSDCVATPLLTSVVELVPVLLVPFPVELAPLVLLLVCVEVALVALEVALLDPDVELLSPEVVLALGTALPLGPPESVEHDATSVGMTTHEAAERNVDK